VNTVFNCLPKNFGRNPNEKQYENRLSPSIAGLVPGRCVPAGNKRSFHSLSLAPQADGFSAGLSPAPQAEPQAAGFSAGLSPAPQAEPQAAGFSAGLSPAPQEEPFCRSECVYVIAYASSYNIQGEITPHT
jgi:hypothetical protein